MKKTLLTIAATIALATSAQAFETYNISNAKCKTLKDGLSGNGYSRFDSLSNDWIIIDGNVWDFEYVNRTKNKVVGIKSFGIYDMGSCKVKIGSITELEAAIKEKESKRQQRLLESAEEISKEFGL